MDDIDKTLQEILDSYVSNELETKVERFNEVLLKKGFSIIKMTQTMTSDGGEVLNGGAIKRPSTVYENEKLAAFCDIAAAKFAKLTQDSSPLFKRAKWAFAQELLESIIQILAFTVIAIDESRDARPGMKFSIDLAMLQRMAKDLRMKVEGKIVLVPGKFHEIRTARQAGLNEARASLHLAEITAGQLADSHGGERTIAISSIISELYDLTIGLYRYYEIHL